MTINIKFVAGKENPWEADSSVGVGWSGKRQLAIDLYEAST